MPQEQGDPEGLISMPDHLRTPDIDAASQASVAPERGIVSTPADEFKGDPSRVMGHPSNPDAGIMQAYAEQLASNEGTSTTLPAPQSTTTNPSIDRPTTTTSPGIVNTTQKPITTIPDKIPEVPSSGD